MQRYAYITCLTNERYLPGLFALCESLKQVDTKYGLYVLIPDYNKALGDEVINSGLVVIQPKEGMAEEYIKTIPAVYMLRKEKGLFCGDQDVVHYLNKKWPDPEHLKLPEGYNEFLSCCGKFIRKSKNGINDLYIVHFIGPRKPWEENPLRLVGSYLIRFKFIEAKLLIKYLKVLKKYK